MSTQLSVRQTTSAEMNLKRACVTMKEASRIRTSGYARPFPPVSSSTNSYPSNFKIYLVYDVPGSDQIWIVPKICQLPCTSNCAKDRILLEYSSEAISCPRKYTRSGLRQQVQLTIMTPIYLLPSTVFYSRLWILGQLFKKQRQDPSFWLHNPSG